MAVQAVQAAIAQVLQVGAVLVAMAAEETVELVELAVTLATLTAELVAQVDQAGMLMHLPRLALLPLEASLQLQHQATAVLRAVTQALTVVLVALQLAAV